MASRDNALMAPHAIRVASLSKEYRIGGQVHATLYDRLSHWLGSARHTGSAHPPAAEDRFWALRDVNFEVAQGEVVGVVGRNGAGKSTLLKVLSRISHPTQGRIELRGRLASLLEVGTGFHPELTGRENIFLNGAVLGMTRAEVLRKFDEIVAFAEIERFVDTVVKHYSSGMYVRLAFAVAAHLEADTLLVDEVLAVGDADFQRKSLGKMSSAARSGRTVLFVSHNLGAVRDLCSRTIVLEKGSLAFDGPSDAALRYYESSFVTGGLAGDAVFEGPLAASVRLQRVTFRQYGATCTAVDPMDPVEIELQGESLRDFPAAEIKLAFFRDGVHVTSCHDTAEPQPLREGGFTCRFRLPAAAFRSGRYMLGVGLATGRAGWAWGADVAAIDFIDNRAGRSPDRSGGLISISYEATRDQ